MKESIEKDLARKTASTVIGKSKKDAVKKVVKKAKIKSAKREPCLCGCKGIPSNRGSRFMQGHDMKLRSKLLKTSRNGGDQQIRMNALKQLRSLGWA